LSIGREADFARIPCGEVANEPFVTFHFVFVECGECKDLIVLRLADEELLGRMHGNVGHGMHVGFGDVLDHNGNAVLPEGRRRTEEKKKARGGHEEEQTSATTTHKQH